MVSAMKKIKWEFAIEWQGTGGIRMAKGTGMTPGYLPACGEAASLRTVRGQSVLGRGISLAPKP